MYLFGGKVDYLYEFESGRYDRHNNIVHHCGLCSIRSVFTKCIGKLSMYSVTWTF